MILFLVIGIPLILKQNKTITNIFAIKKDWVSKDSTEKGEREITWSMPENVMSFSFVHLLDERTKNNLPFFLKLQSGMYFKGLYDFWLRKVSFVKFQDVVFTIRE
jgi:hypothetical protein